MSLYDHFKSESTCSMKGNRGNVLLQVQAHAVHICPALKLSPSALRTFHLFRPGAQRARRTALLPAGEVGTPPRFPPPARSRPRSPRQPNNGRSVSPPAELPLRGIGSPRLRGGKNRPPVPTSRPPEPSVTPKRRGGGRERSGAHLASPQPGPAPAPGCG